MAIRARPVHDRIIVKAEKKSNITEGGIEIVEHRPQKERVGEVVAVGPGILDQNGKFVPVSVKVGERVVFGSYAGTEITIDGESYQIMREGDIALVVGPDVNVSTDGIVGRRSDVASHYR